MDFVDHYKLTAASSLLSPDGSFSSYFPVIHPLSQTLRNARNRYFKRSALRESDGSSQTENSGLFIMQ